MSTEEVRDAWETLPSLIGRHIRVGPQEAGPVPRIFRGPIRLVRVEKDRVVIKCSWLMERPASKLGYVASKPRSIVVIKREAALRKQGDMICFDSEDGEAFILPLAESVRADQLYRIEREEE